MTSLSHDELDLVLRIMRAHASGLLIEISRTDSRRFRDTLKHEQAMVEGIVQRLSADVAGDRSAAVAS
jgi:hypothetical protein